MHATAGALAVLKMVLVKKYVAIHMYLLLLGYDNLKLNKNLHWFFVDFML